MKGNIETYYGTTGELMCKVKDHQAALDANDRKWQEKVEGLVKEWEAQPERLISRKTNFDDGAASVYAGCAAELREKLLEDK